LEAVWWKFSHRPGNPATVEVARWQSAGYRRKLSPVTLIAMMAMHPTVWRYGGAEQMRKWTIAVTSDVGVIVAEGQAQYHILVVEAT